MTTSSASSRTPATGPPTVVVVGRQNVGKSTLVNRLTGRRDAIVQARPGVTRDRTTHEAAWTGERFVVVDTGGWTPGWLPERDALDVAVAAQAELATEAADLILLVVDTGGWTPGWLPERDALDVAVAAQAELATEAADLVLLVVDLSVGITEEDMAVAAWLREAELDVLLVANKADQPRDTPQLRADLAELYPLGVGDPVPVSALHGRGSGDLLDRVVARLRASGATRRPVEVVPEVPGVALIGRPNVGKSSLFNRLVGADRVLVDERPGTTRDAVDSLVRFPDGRTYRFVDTAGLRRRRSARDTTEYYSTVRTVQALDAAAVALLVVDAGEPVGEQEQRLARQILDAGRALVVVLNKWDLVDEERRERIDAERDRLLSFVDWAPLVRTSATTGRGLRKLPDRMDAVLAEWSRRVPTAALNEWLAEVTAAQEPPMRAGRRVRLRYITQVAAGPPTFRVFTTGPLEAGYVRYLERRLREAFGFAGTPLDVGVRVRPGWSETGRTASTQGSGQRGRGSSSEKQGRGRSGRGRARR